MDTVPDLVVDTGTGQVVVPAVRAEHTTVVELHGDIDMETLQPLRDCVLAGIEENNDVVVDLTDVALIDCASLGALVQADRLAERRGRNLSLLAPSAMTRRTLAGAGLSKTFRVIQGRSTSVSGAYRGG
ncbi:STAS domain-containing protein [Actinoplanes sp. NPDC051343]|uniref:STAS domain-containing protein n=1 Tax=Actinoplanes sp. NPDC051343 TaxID=3363906 RepID=UPI0037A92632